MKLVPFNAGESPEGDEEKARFQNRKTEAATRLFRLMEEGRFSMPNHPRAIAELASYQRKISSSGKQKIEDPAGKSPDFGDSSSPAMRRLLGY